MYRRTFLTVAALATAGCMGASDAVETTDTTPTPTDANPGTRPADGVTPDPDPPALDGVDCPPAGDTVARQVCSLTTDLDDAPVALAPPRPARFAPTTGDDTIESFTFTLTNQSSLPFGFNPYGWRLRRHDDGEWVHVAPDATPEPWTTLAPGEQYGFSISVESVPTQRVDGSRAIVLDLESGVYAFGVEGQLERDDGDERIECVAVFAVER